MMASATAHDATATASATASSTGQATGTGLGHSLGHSFTKKTYHRPTYCHHCGDMLWGLIGQGYSCEGECHLLTVCVHACVHASCQWDRVHVCLCAPLPPIPTRFSVES